MNNCTHVWTICINLSVSSWKGKYQTLSGLIMIDHILTELRHAAVMKTSSPPSVFLTTLLASLGDYWEKKEYPQLKFFW